jgi:hypothetical protein
MHHAHSSQHILDKPQGKSSLKMGSKLTIIRSSASVSELTGCLLGRISLLVLPTPGGRCHRQIFAGTEQRREKMPSV